MHNLQHDLRLYLCCYCISAGLARHPARQHSAHLEPPHAAADNCSSAAPQPASTPTGVTPAVRKAIAGAIPLEHRRVLGRLAKGFIDEGRLQWLTQQGFKVSIVRNTPLFEINADRILLCAEAVLLSAVGITAQEWLL